MSDMLAMMKSFFRDAIAYRKEIRKQDEWIRRFAEKKGYAVNPHWMFYTNLKIWLVESELLFGKRYCPCFEPTGDAEFDRKLICPCAFLKDEVEARGTCHCTLFGRADLTNEQWKAAEARLMEEYRGVPLRWDGDVLDTRGMERDPLRNLPVPDALHQVKRALQTHQGPSLPVAVATKAEADHLELLAKSRGMTCTIEQRDDHWLVTLTRRS